MKRLSIIFLVLAMLLAGAGFAPYVAASQLSPGEPDPTPSSWLFLPFLSMKETGTITGRVLDPESQPLPGVTITGEDGKAAKTDGSGRYTLSDVPRGIYALHAKADGVTFVPAIQEVNVSAGENRHDFNALTACVELVNNGGFEAGETAWTLPITERTAQVVTTAAHTGSRALSTGAFSAGANNFSYSSGRQTVIIPADAGSATLRAWLFPTTNEAKTAALAPEPTGLNFGDEALANDAQYVLVIDTKGTADLTDDVVLQTLLWQRVNNPQWTLYEFDVSRYIGRTITVQFGVYNDGVGGFTGMYVDDVSLQACPAAPPTTPPPAAGCTNRFVNSTFEDNTGWQIPITEYSAAYSKEFKLEVDPEDRSMRTGIFTDPNKFSYSDAYQLATIPAGSASATLNLWVYPISGEVLAGAKTAQSLPEAPAPAVGEVFGAQALSSDVQYVLVLDPFGRILETLLWMRSDAQQWANLQFDLSRYAGQTIRIQFGTFNNGSGGKTAMYVDNALLDTCPSGAATPTPTLPPAVTPTATATSTPIPTATPTLVPTAGPTATPLPPTCSDRIANPGFEQFAAWHIPITEFSAGYSTTRAHTGAMSMRTGIIAPFNNVFSYSDFRQTVSIPVDSSRVTLTFWAYPISEDGTDTTVSLQSAMMEAAPGQPLAIDSDTNDRQYLLVLDWFGNWIDTLVWMNSDAQTWQQFTIDLTRYAGRTISLQYGTFNNGAGGRTAMFVDDVSLVVCP